MSSMDSLFCISLLVLHKLLLFLLAHWRDFNQNNVDLQRSHFLYQKPNSNKQQSEGRKGHNKAMYTVATNHCREVKQSGKDWGVGQRTLKEAQQKDAPQSPNRHGSYMTVGPAECGEEKCAPGVWWEHHHWSTQPHTEATCSLYSAPPHTLLCCSISMITSMWVLLLTCVIWRHVTVISLVSWSFFCSHVKLLHYSEHPPVCRSAVCSPPPAHKHSLLFSSLCSKMWTTNKYK